MTDHEPVRRAREATVRDEGDGVAEPFADERGGHVQHLAHAGPAGRALVADDDHVAGHDAARLHGLEAGLLESKTRAGPRWRSRSWPASLTTHPSGGEVAVEDRKPACRLQRSLQRDDDLLARPLLDGGRDLAERAAVDVGRAGVDELPLEELARDESDTARLVDVRRDEAPSGLQARHDRGPRGDAVEVVEGELDVELAGDRDQVKDAVRRAARGGDRRDRVLERIAGDHVRRPEVAAQKVHHEPACRLGRLVLARRERGDPVQARRADPEEIERGRHRVRGELAAARARARAGDALELVQLVGAHAPDGVRADRLEHVLDGHVAAAEPTRRDRAVVEDEAREVESRQRDHRGRDGLVAADQADEPVEQVSACDELDRVGDHLAGDERGAHAFRPHADAVGDRHGVELDRCAAGRAHARLHVLRELALVEVARHRLDPRRGDADERPREILVGETDALQIARAGARSGPSVIAALCRFAGSEALSYGSLTLLPLLSPRP